MIHDGEQRMIIIYRASLYQHVAMMLHCKNKIVKITNLLVSTVARNSGNCNLIGHVGCYGHTCNYNLIIIISISLSCLY